MRNALVLIAVGLAVMFLSLLTVNSGRGQSFPNDQFVLGLAVTLASVLRVVYLLVVRPGRGERL